jgi:flagellar protein FlaG
MMIIQNGNRPAQDSQLVGRPGGDAAKIVAVASGRGAAVDLSQAPAAPQASNEQLKKAVDEINRAMQQSGRSLQFSVDSATDRVVVRLTDTETGEVIRQIPSEETLEIARSIGQFQQGLLLKQQA